MTQRYENLQALRAAATMAVVLANLYPIEWTYFGTQWIPRMITRLESAAFDLLFVLSGFVVTVRYGRSSGGARIATRFLLRRAIRIYPLYWLAMAVALLQSGATPRALIEAAPHASLLSQLGLLPAAFNCADDWLLAQMRALSVGLYCYVVFALLLAIMGGRRLVVGLLVWTSVIYLGRLLADIDERWPALFFGFAALEFIGGAFAAKAMEDEVSSIPAIFALLAGMLFVATPWTLGLGSWQQTLHARDSLCFAIIGILAVWCLASLERIVGIKVPRCLSALGDASYPMWLFHVAVGSGTATLLTRIVDPARLHGLGITACIATVLLIGCLFHRLIERPLLARRPRAGDA
ncbi:acyltransferase family protein [Chitinasiproducens palmae]|nr:acyltransferase [Chitinasiproducens palmae]